MSRWVSGVVKASASGAQVEIPSWLLWINSHHRKFSGDASMEDAVVRLTNHPLTLSWLVGINTAVNAKLRAASLIMGKSTSCSRRESSSLAYSNIRVTSFKGANYPISSVEFKPIAPPAKQQSYKSTAFNNQTPPAIPARSMAMMTAHAMCSITVDFLLGLEAKDENER